MLIDLASIVTITVLLLGLVLAGHLSREFAMLAALGLVALRAFGRQRGTLTGKVFTIALPITAFLLLVNTYAATPAERSALSGAVLLLVIILVSFFILLGGASRRRQ